MWKSSYTDRLSLQTHEPVEADEILRGVIDYYVCKLSPLGPYIPDRPILVVAEAKCDNFGRGRGQAFAGMLAAQKLDGIATRTYYGISTNGRGWEFGKLEGDLFTLDTRTFGIGEPERLASAVHFVFSAARDQLRAAA